MKNYVILGAVVLVLAAALYYAYKQVNRSKGQAIVVTGAASEPLIYNPNGGPSIEEVRRQLG